MRIVLIALAAACVIGAWALILSDLNDRGNKGC